MYRLPLFGDHDAMCIVLNEGEDWTLRLLNAALSVLDSVFQRKRGAVKWGDGGGSTIILTRGFFLSVLEDSINS